jgi:hypothetical protein
LAKRALMPGDRQTLDLFGADGLPQGFRYQPEFLNREEEGTLFRDIRSLPFREFEFHGFTGKRRIVSFGWRYDFNGGGLTRTEDMPEFLAGLRARAESYAGFSAGRLQHVLLRRRRRRDRRHALRCRRSAKGGYRDHRRPLRRVHRELATTVRMRRRYIPDRPRCLHCFGTCLLAR